MPRANRYVVPGMVYHVTHRCHDRRCLKYIDLNMVRAGVLRHPRDWKWCGYHELVGARKRYRIIDTDEVIRQSPALVTNGTCGPPRLDILETKSVGYNHMKGNILKSVTFRTDKNGKGINETL